ncbi:MAG: hypothetical protein H3C30_06065 [Candidatus Hydrogenedentes bacterium]|nr:hypothetical protein [Candidatus Hydrogenedentota bacterium]
MIQRQNAVKNAYLSVLVSIFISVAMLLAIPVSADELSEMKDGVANNLPCSDVNFETSWQKIADDMFDAASTKIDTLTEDEDERSAVKEDFVTIGPRVVIELMISIGYAKPLECLPIECRDAAKLVIFKHWLEFGNEGALHDLASEKKGDNQDNESISNDFRDSEIIPDHKIKVGLGEVLSSELLTKFYECWQETYSEIETTSISFLLSVKDSDKVLNEDELRIISEIVGEARMKVWWHRVSCPDVNVSELRRDARRKVILELKGKVSDRGLSFAKDLLLLNEEQEQESSD